MPHAITRITRLATPLAHATRAALICALATLLLPAPTQAQPADPYNYSRTSSFTYQANGLLQSETVEPVETGDPGNPGDPNLCVTTTYTYDAWGNKDTASTAGCPGASARAVFTPRSSASTYTAQTVSVGTLAGVLIPAGQFATTATNALSQSETRAHDPRFGGVTRLTGPNGLATTFEYDDFGRPVKETRADGSYTTTYHCIIAGRNLDTGSNSAGCVRGRR